MRNWTTGAAALALVFTSFHATAFQTEVLQSAGPTDKRVNVIIVGDGYRAEDQTLLTQRARDFVAELWTHPAFGEYQQFFNVKVVHSISADDGAVNGNNPPSQPTIFQSYFNCGGIDRLLCVGDTAMLSQVLATDAPEYDSRFDIVLVSVNDSKYGGAGGSYATASADASAPHIAIHEIGHSFGGLADEYDYGNSAPSTTEFVEPNATIQTVRANIKWNVWIDPTTPIPTPEEAGYGNVVGLFEGAVYYPTGQYRPWDNCEMKVLGVEFCPVCTEALIWSVYDKTDPIETVTPSTSTVTVPATGSQVFSFSGPQPKLSTLSPTWYLDGMSVGGTTSFSITGASLGSTQHVLTLTVRDLTSRVRRDPNGVLSSTFSWTVKASSNPGTGGAGGGGGTSASGGRAAGGTVTGGRPTGGATTGGRATGGRTGSGGAPTGGRPTGGAPATGGRSNTGGTSGVANPCAGLCSSPLVFTGPNYQSGNLGTGAICRETKASLNGGNCSNMQSRILSVNGTTMNCSGWVLPAKRSGGYCVQVTAGTPDYASFATW